MQHQGKIMTAVFDIFNDREISREARRDLESTLAAIIRFTDGDWGTSESAEANDICARRGLIGHRIIGVYGDTLVSAEIEVINGYLFTKDIRVETAKDACRAPRGASKPVLV